jgi:hypothetical protein
MLYLQKCFPLPVVCFLISITISPSKLQHVNVTTIDAIVAASAHMRRDPLARIDVIKLDIEVWL